MSYLFLLSLERCRPLSVFDTLLPMSLLSTVCTIYANNYTRTIAAIKGPNVSLNFHLDRVKRIWYLSPMRAANVQASLRIRAVSPEPSLLAHTSSESRGIFRQKARSLAPLNGWVCAVKICHDGMLEDTNSLDGAHLGTQHKSHIINQQNYL